MKYYSEADLAAILDTVLDIRDKQSAQMKLMPIKVRFCRDCPLFEPNYWQKDPVVTIGWCRRMSHYETMEDEPPFYVYVNSNSFCNEDDIVDVY